MEKIGIFIASNIYLVVCIILALAIFVTILSIVISNKKKRKQIKEDFVMAEKIEEIEEKEEKNSELENIIKQMQEDIEVKPEEVVKKFEDEQEEKAIISYQELVDNVKQGKIDIEEDDNGNVNFVEELTESEPIMEVEDVEPSVTPIMVKEAIEAIDREKKEEEIKQFKNSEFISPIYGKMDNNVEYPTVKKRENIIDLMNTKDYNELTEEIKKQEEFLHQLIEFRNNL